MEDSGTIKFDKNITFSEKTEKEENNNFNKLENKNNIFKENTNIFKKIQNKKFEKVNAVKLTIKSTKYLIVLNFNLIQLILTLCYVGLIFKMIQDGVFFINKITTELICLNLLLFLLIFANYKKHTTDIPCICRLKK